MMAMLFIFKVFQEVLRLYPPAFALDKEAPENLKLGGYSISKGTVVKVRKMYIIRCDSKLAFKMYKLFCTCSAPVIFLLGCQKTVMILLLLIRVVLTMERSKFLFFGFLFWGGKGGKGRYTRVNCNTIYI